MDIRDYGIIIGEGTPGKSNLITDVEGVKVGHCTIDEGDIHTGVTVIVPCADVYEQKPVAACHVINGFGKTAGLVQIEELGCIESPIALTNTLSVHAGLEGLVQAEIKRQQANGKRLRTYNAVCGETNDSAINAIEKLAVRPEHVIKALSDSKEDFELGAVGAGRGTICFGLKGGIGSASRVMEIEGKTYTMGVLVQSNFGASKDLTINGIPLGKRIKEQKEAEDKGSVMVVSATDLPVSYRQLRRILKRAVTGLVNTGSKLGHGSGDIVIGFTTANRMNTYRGLNTAYELPEFLLNVPFRMMAECTEEAVLNSMINADQDVTLDGEIIHSLKEYINLL